MPIYQVRSEALRVSEAWLVRSRVQEDLEGVRRGWRAARMARIHLQCIWGGKTALAFGPFSLPLSSFERPLSPPGSPSIPAVSGHTV